MNEHMPEPLVALVQQLSKLPGFGPKSAMRAAMTMLAWPKAKTQQLGQSIALLRDKLCLCSRCCGLASEDPCQICRDPVRTQTSLCLVTEWDSMLTIDQGGFYHGQYFVLGGLLAPLEQKDAASLNIQKLISRLSEGVIEELILALGATIDAETTTSWLITLLHTKFPKLRITRFAQGMPLGSEVKYMDRETLKQSLDYRQQLC
ncbi:MAG: recombination protein RecR [Desulfovibrio sp.]|nr:recombination protein RecR [Desulfovibrio sp.]